MISEKYTNQLDDIRKKYSTYGMRPGDPLKNLKDNKRYSEISRIEEEFKNELIKEYFTEGHPKAQKLWEYAWREGHSEGYSSVENLFLELSELLK